MFIAERARAEQRHSHPGSRSFARNSGPFTNGYPSSSDECVSYRPLERLGLNSRAPYYDYFGRDGDFLFRKFRHQKAEGSKGFVHFKKSKRGNFYLSRGGFLERALYRWPTDDTKVVIIVEGEKDADNVAKLGLIDGSGAPVLATTSGGCTSWSDVLAEDLIGKYVVLMRSG